MMAWSGREWDEEKSLLPERFFVFGPGGCLCFMEREDRGFAHREAQYRGRAGRGWEGRKEAWKIEARRDESRNPDARARGVFVSFVHDSTVPIPFG